MIRLKGIVQFPASVTSDGIVRIVKSNGQYAFSLDYSQLSDATSLDPAAIRFLAYNRLTGVYSLVSMASVLAGGSASQNVSGAYSATNVDTYLRLTAQSTITLPPAANRAGLEITAKDVAGVANTSPSALMPSGTEDIDGITAGQGGYPIQANFQVVRLKPRTGGYDVMHSG